MTAGLTLTGDKHLIKALKELPPAVTNRAVAYANVRVMAPVLKKARSLVPQRYGILKKSLGAKTKKYPKKGVVFTIIGPRAGFRQDIGSEVSMGTTRGEGGRFKSKGTKVLNTVADPLHYAHLVELGHGGPHPASDHPYLRPAWDGQQSTMLPRYKGLIWEGIKREARRVSR